MHAPASWPSPDTRAIALDDENLAAIVRATADGLIEDCNAAFARLFGFASTSDARGRRLCDLYPDQAWSSWLARVRRERTLRGVPTQARRADGRPLPIVQTLVGEFGPDGELVGLTLLALDDTPRQTLETHLREVVRMETVGRLASAMAHDFSNLLMVINGLGESLLERLSPDDPLRPDFAQLLDAGRRAATLTRQLMAVSRKPTSRPTLLDLDDVVRAAKPLIERLVGPHVELAVNCTPGAKLIAADRDQLEQVLLNLATNARDAMPEGGRLLLRTETAGDTVVLTLADTGTGMPPDISARIFEPFFTTKPRGKGTGLGLWQVQSILSEHQGTIEVHSERGRGTTFEIRLPRPATTIAATPPNANDMPAAPPTRGGDLAPTERAMSNGAH